MYSDNLFQCMCCTSDAFLWFCCNVSIPVCNTSRTHRVKRRAHSISIKSTEAALMCHHHGTNENIKKEITINLLLNLQVRFFFLAYLRLKLSLMRVVLNIL